jgi:hypothetical protein
MSHNENMRSHKAVCGGVRLVMATLVVFLISILCFISAAGAAVTVDDVTEIEGTGLQFTVSLDNAVAGAFSVEVTLADVTAIGGAAPLVSPEDYDNVVATLNFAGSAGETQQFTVATLDDALLEGPETFTVNLNASDPLVTDTDTGTGTISDNDSATVAFQTGTSATADESAGNHAIAVILSVPSGTTPSPITVDVTDSGGGSATSGTDYSAAGTVPLTFPAGSANGAIQTFNLGVLADTDVEGDETVDLQLGNVTGTQAILGAQTTHTATIIDDDFAKVAFQADTSATADEDAAGNHAVTVVLSVPSGTTPSAITVDVTDAGGGTATSGTDYSPVGTATLTFPAGSSNGATQTFNLGILSDAFAEGIETVNLQMGNVTGTGAIVGSQTTHTVSITDDDLASKRSVSKPCQCHR